jgi:hypothetical protein
VCGRVVPILLLAATWLPCVAEAMPQRGNEYQVKAAFILNFARFVEWPSDAISDGTLVVGVMGDDPFGGAIDSLNSNNINGRRLVIRRLKWGDNLRSCHILFVSSSEQNRVWKITESLRGASVLTIGEMPQFNQAGGIIKFIVENNKVRFEINAAAAGQARLKISSKLLALSKGGKN